MKNKSISYYEWLAEVKAMDRSLDSKEKMKVWGKFAWKKPLNLPPRRNGSLVNHFGGEKDGQPLNFVIR